MRYCSAAKTCNNMVESQKHFLNERSQTPEYTLSDLFMSYSRTDKTMVCEQKNTSWGQRLTAEWQEGVFWSDGNVLYVTVVVDMQLYTFFKRNQILQLNKSYSSIKLIFKAQVRGTWVTQSVKHLTVGFSPGCDIRIVRSCPLWDSALSMESV